MAERDQSLDETRLALTSQTAALERAQAALSTLSAREERLAEKAAMAHGRASLAALRDRCFAAWRGAHTSAKLHHASEMAQAAAQAAAASEATIDSLRAEAEKSAERRAAGHLQRFLMRGRDRCFVAWRGMHVSAIREREAAAAAAAVAEASAAVATSEANVVALRLQATKAVEGKATAHLQRYLLRTRDRCFVAWRGLHTRAQIDRVAAQAAQAIDPELLERRDQKIATLEMQAGRDKEVLRTQRQHIQDFRQLLAASTSDDLVAIVGMMQSQADQNHVILATRDRQMAALKAVVPAEKQNIIAENDRLRGLVEVALKALSQQDVAPSPRRGRVMAPGHAAVEASF